ncbi:hypothetical protein FQZ97_975740 [compost metagenome]
MVPESLCATAPSSTLSVPLLPKSAPIITGPRLVQVDAAPPASRPDTVNVPTPPSKLPIKAQSLTTVPPASMFNVPATESPTVRSPPTVQCGVWIGPGKTSPEPETDCAYAG